MENQEEQIAIKFDTISGENEMDAIAAAAATEAVATMIHEVYLAFGDNRKLLVKARPFSIGSFEIPLDIILVAVASVGLFDGDVIKNILNIIKEYFRIKNLLKGGIPKIEGNKVIIEDNDINVENITINLLGEDSRANQLTTKAIDRAKSDDDIKEIQIYNETKKQEIARISKEQFEYYEKKETMIDLPEDQIKNEKVVLVIRSPVLEANDNINWKFILHGKQILANITDKEFLAKVNIGEPFAAGDTLEVNLQIKQKYDKMYGIYIDAKKTITKIYVHNKRARQPSFFE